MKSNYIFDWDYIIDIHIEQFKLFKPLEQNLESYVKNNNVIELMILNYIYYRKYN